MKGKHFQFDLDFIVKLSINLDAAGVSVPRVLFPYLDSGILIPAVTRSWLSTH